MRGSGAGCAQMLSQVTEDATGFWADDTKAAHESASNVNAVFFIFVRQCFINMQLSINFLTLQWLDTYHSQVDYSSTVVYCGTKIVYY